MAAGKQYKIKVRLKIRNRLFKKAGLAASVVAAAFILGYCCFLAARLAARMPVGRLFAFTAKSSSVNSPSEEISAEISRRMAGKLGRTFSWAEGEAFAAGLKNSYPALGRVEVKRNFMSGCVSVRAESENVVAKVRSTARSFIFPRAGACSRNITGPDPGPPVFGDGWCIRPAGKPPREVLGSIPGGWGRLALGPLAAFF